MMVSRVVSIFLRFGEFVSGAVVLGIMAYLLHRYDHDHDHVESLSRLIYSVIIAALSVLFSLVWLIPSTSSMLHYPFDLIISAAWFAVFGVLVNWIERAKNCGGAFHWSNMRFRGSYCGQWKTAEAFSFISACFWFVSFLLAVVAWRSGYYEWLTYPSLAPVSCLSN